MVKSFSKSESTSYNKSESVFIISNNAPSNPDENITVEVKTNLNNIVYSVPINKNDHSYWIKR